MPVWLLGIIVWAGLLFAALGWWASAAVCAGMWLVGLVIRYALFAAHDDAPLDNITYAMLNVRLCDVPLALRTMLGPTLGLQVALVILKWQDWTLQPWWWIALPTYAYIALAALLLGLMAMAARPRGG